MKNLGHILTTVIALTVFGASAQTPEISVRFANPYYNASTKIYRLDVEMKSNPAGSQLFGMNVRFFYDDVTLEYLSMGDFVSGYGELGTASVMTGSEGSGQIMFDFPEAHPAVFVNGAAQLFGSTAVQMSNNAWTKYFSVYFHVDDPEAWNVSSFCPSVIWDLSYEPEFGGLFPGDDGVVITVVSPPPYQSEPSSELAVNFNWEFGAYPYDMPFGSPASTTCIPTIQALTAPVLTLVQPDCILPTGSIIVTTPTGPGMTYSIDGVNYTNTTGAFSGVVPGSYTVTAKSAEGTVSSGTGAVMIPGGIATISGYVLYGSLAGAGINGVSVSLKNQAGQVIATATSMNNPVSGTAGYYAFCDIPAGTGYQLGGTFYGPRGGDNATDALLVQLAAAGILTPPFNELQEFAADVNTSQYVTALDALYIKLRTAGSVNSYPAGEWTFSSAVVSVTGQPVSQNLWGLCVGDVNASYNMTGSKSTQGNPVINDGLVTAGTGESCSISIRSNAMADLGAMTLYLGFDPGLIEVTGIAGLSEGMSYTVRGGRISIAWSDTRTFHAVEGGDLLNLTVRIKQNLSTPTSLFSVLPGSEFADGTAMVYDRFDLRMPNVVTGSKSVLALTNYPNSFQSKTTIEYTLPSPGHVRLLLNDVYGRTIPVFDRSTEEAGRHTYSLDAGSLGLTVGTYVGRILFENESGSWEESRKMVLSR